jgi:hypothetical protein
LKTGFTNRRQSVPDDERSGNETTEPTEETPDVEGHGAKKVVGVGLAAAALIGSGAAAVKLTDGDSSGRTAGALTSENIEKAAGDPKAADRDGDGYVTYSDLAHEGFKWAVDDLLRESEVSALGLSAAGWKMSLEHLGAEGFAIKGESIFLKGGVDENLDKLLQGSAAEWTKKVRSLDRDEDGYAASKELDAAGFKFNVGAVNEEGVKAEPGDLAEAGYKLPLATLDSGDFAIKGESIFIKIGVDPELDQLFRKD